MTSKRKAPRTTQTSVTELQPNDQIRLISSKARTTDCGSHTFGAGSILSVVAITTEIRRHAGAKGHRYYVLEIPNGMTISFSSSNRVARLDAGQDYLDNPIDILPGQLAEAREELVEPRRNIHPDDVAEVAAIMTDPDRFPQAETPAQELRYLRAELFILADVARKRARAEATDDGANGIDALAEPEEPAEVDSEVALRRATEIQGTRRAADPLDPSMHSAYVCTVDLPHPDWLGFIQAANGVEGGTDARPFGAPIYCGPWWAGGYVEHYAETRVILPMPDRDRAGQREASDGKVRTWRLRERADGAIIAALTGTAQRHLATAAGMRSVHAVPIGRVATAPGIATAGSPVEELPVVEHVTRTPPTDPEMFPETRPAAPELRLEVSAPQSLFDVAGAPRLPL